MMTRILPNRTWAMTQVGDLINTFNGDNYVTDIKNAGGVRTIRLDNGLNVIAFANDYVNRQTITIRRPLAKTRPAGVTLADRVTTESVVHAAIARKIAEGTPGPVKVTLP